MSDEYWTPAFELILEEARRSIDRQSERVQHARERAVALVGFGSIVAAALGLGSDPTLGSWGLVGVAAFVVVAGASLFVLFPRKFEFELSAKLMDEWFDDSENQGINHMLRTTAMRHEEHHARNHDRLGWIQLGIMVGVVSLAIETVALVARLVLG
ncbi:MAG: hypothetical protein U0R78_19620 [Nocardioidaceae bacterium]